MQVMPVVVRAVKRVVLCHPKRMIDSLARLAMSSGVLCRSALLAELGSNEA